MNPNTVEIIGFVLFTLAILHTFFANQIARMSSRYPADSISSRFFHLIGEVELIFALWAVVFLVCYGFTTGFMNQSHDSASSGMIQYLENTSFAEPVFVFVIMSMAASKPILSIAEKIILSLASLLPFSRKFSFYVSALITGPLLGSFITEPAAMTVTALILLEYFYSTNISEKFKYSTLGLLFVNISIGGTMTHFAAPPVLMVAGKYGWGIEHMFFNFGYKAALSVIAGTFLTAFVFREELKGDLKDKREEGNTPSPQWWIVLMHIFFLCITVQAAHHPVFLIGLFFCFLGFVTITKKYQDDLRIKGPLLVGLFLSGLIILGKMQTWWLQDIVTSLNDLSLFFGSAGLTAFCDNAALTYLGSLVDLSESAQYNLVAGAVAGGGLTVIANAPNPAGHSILKNSFSKGINPLGLLAGALIPTLLICLLFQILP